MVTSNSEWIVPATEDERRFFVLEVGDAKQQDTTYFAAIDKQMENGGAEAMLYDLLNYDYGGVDLRNPPKTQWLAEQVEQGLDDKESWLLEILRSGQISEANGSYMLQQDRETDVQRRDMPLHLSPVQ